MECTSTHRSALLSRLEEALESKGLLKKLLNERQNGEHEHFAPFTEVDLFLCRLKIEAIRKALTENILENF